MATPEGRIKNAVCSWLSFHGVFFWIHDSVGIYDPKLGRYRANTNRYRIKGVSDIEGILDDGRYIAIEVKSLTGRVSPEQNRFQENVRRHRGIAFIARGIGDLERYLLPILKATREKFAGPHSGGTGETEERKRDNS